MYEYSTVELVSVSDFLILFGSCERSMASSGERRELPTLLYCIILSNNHNAMSDHANTFQKLG
jgi:hypothetical protein